MFGENAMPIGRTFHARNLDRVNPVCFATIARTVIQMDQQASPE
jgi:hypothetical protein